LETLKRLRADGWTVAILSGGFLPAIRPLARFLGVDVVEAVDLTFTGDGAYSGFDETHPNARNGGKPEVIRNLRKERGFGIVVMVGDGVSDLETKSEVDLFIGYGGFTPGKGEGRCGSVRDQARGGCGRSGAAGVTAG